MKLNLNEYRVNKRALELQLERYPLRDILITTSEFSVISHCPILALLYFLGELRGFTPEVEAEIAAMTKFYDYTKVVGRL